MPVDIDLNDVMKTHPLITDFPPLPSRDLIVAAAQQQNPPSYSGPSFPIAPIIGGIVGGLIGGQGGGQKNPAGRKQSGRAAGREGGGDAGGAPAVRGLGGGVPGRGGVYSDGKFFWVSGRYNGVVYAIDTTTGKLLNKIPVGSGPHGLCVFPQPGRYSLGHTGVYR